MQSRLGSQPSLIWRSIWSARGLIEKGIRWKVGNGRSISILNDCWLPNPSPKRLDSSPISGLHWVSYLFSPDTHSWNEELIRSSFLPREATQILSIPLLSFPQSDCIVWSGVERKQGFMSFDVGINFCWTLLIYHWLMQHLTKSSGPFNVHKKSFTGLAFSLEVRSY
ncbi:hypothetical protein HRI_004108100 [Hibiscus trionum]|uniref:Reverse transcriptase zinc-binding domain-containing protein n=1 Tax=Hibiscus trionum TaxID=183268 RepID=A0A9W7MJL1_HIBTR|nr:hypothetical protein HRI_004108100 [Hibiscus trionum]